MTVSKSSSLTSPSSSGLTMPMRISSCVLAASSPWAPANGVSDTNRPARKSFFSRDSPPVLALTYVPPKKHLQDNYTISFRKINFFSNPYSSCKELRPRRGRSSLQHIRLKYLTQFPHRINAPAALPHLAKAIAGKDKRQPRRAGAVRVLLGIAHIDGIL